MFYYHLLAVSFVTNCYKNIGLTIRMPIEEVNRSDYRAEFPDYVLNRSKMFSKTIINQTLLSELLERVETNMPKL